MNRPPLCCIATKIGWLYGIQTGQDKRYGCGKCEISFIDIDFKKPNEKLHDELVMKFKPKYATVLDITHETQISSAIMTASWYDGHGVKPIVIPKIDCINEIPHPFILGYSIPTKYGTTPIPIHEFKNRQIHLLGGSPKQIVQYYQQAVTYNCHVTSIDCNSFSRGANFGKTWVNHPKHDWEQIHYENEPEPFIKTISQSLQNAYDFLHENLNPDKIQPEFKLF